MEPPDTEPVQPMSFADKFTNLFLSPGDLFENVRQTGPTNSNWLVPWLIYIIVSIAVGQIVIGNPSLAGQLEDWIKTQYYKEMDEAIREGTITQEQAEQQFEFVRPGTPWFALLSIGGTLMGSALLLFALGLFYHQLGKFAMNSQAPYMKVVEVVGLTFLIGALERIVTTLLMIATDSIHASPSLALLLEEVRPEDKFHIALSKFNAFTFWELGVTSVGLSRLFQRDFPKVLVLVVAFWVIWSIVTIFTGFTLEG